MNHFGLEFRKSKFGLTLDDSKYGGWDTKPSKDILHRSGSINSLGEFTDEYFQLNRINVFYNLQLNLDHFEPLTEAGFIDNLNRILDFEYSVSYGKKAVFESVDDLNDYDTSGVYLLVLGEYKQIYIGQTFNIKNRIRNHWTSNIAFDKLIFINRDISKLSIKSFRALDTTEIYVIPNLTKRDRLQLEYDLVKMSDNRYLTNRTEGG